MTDVFSAEKRSQVMSCIKGKNTKPEMLVRKFLHANGFGYRKNVASMPGRPDLVLSKYKVVIFINGCFWHGHDRCPDFRIPKTRTDWWTEKIRKTKERDQNQIDLIEKMGWETIVIWECEIEKAYNETMQSLVCNIVSRSSQSPSITKNGT